MAKRPLRAHLHHAGWDGGTGKRSLRRSGHAGERRSPAFPVVRHVRLVRRKVSSTVWPRRGAWMPRLKQCVRGGAWPENAARRTRPTLYASHHGSHLARDWLVSAQRPIRYGLARPLPLQEVSDAKFIEIPAGCARGTRAEVHVRPAIYGLVCRQVIQRRILAFVQGVRPRRLSECHSETALFLPELDDRQSVSCSDPDHSLGSRPPSLDVLTVV